ncbi:MAG: thermonuclease family protein [Pseudomonadota bacterium]
MKHVIAVILLFIWLAPPALANVRVVDGDTIRIGDQSYRIYGIDAPEIGQSCGAWACGKDAANALLGMVRGQAVSCEAVETDRYGRIVARCFAGQRDIGAAMVDAGLAWAFRRFSTDYAAKEDAARAARLGVWAHEAIPPWQFREERWDASARKSPVAGCPIKGNISQSGRIYHAPWSPWYSRTRINEAKGERWFCDEREAVEAGWRAPYWP